MTRRQKAITEESSYVSVHKLIIDTPIFPGDVFSSVSVSVTAGNFLALQEAFSHEGILPVAFSRGTPRREVDLSLFCELQSPSADEMSREDLDAYLYGYAGRSISVSLRGLSVNRRQLQDVVSDKSKRDCVVLEKDFYMEFKEYDCWFEKHRFSRIRHEQFSRFNAAFKGYFGRHYETGDDGSRGDRLFVRTSLACHEYVSENPGIYYLLLQKCYSSDLDCLSEFLEKKARERHFVCLAERSKKKEGVMETLRFDSEAKACEYILNHDYPQAVKDAAEMVKGDTDGRGNTLHYLNTLASFPWNVSKKTSADFKEIRRVLDASHFGMDSVKERVVENLILRERAKDTNPLILCLAGAPGTGKTSIVSAIAKALGLPVVKISMGGANDARQLKGFHRAYVGSTSSEIVRGMLVNHCNNPIVLIDEIEKARSSGDGDPHAALLEILDPSQNRTFMDNYMGVPVDLSKATFICTANDISRIPAPLRDRMDFVILQPYGVKEREIIFRRYVLPAEMRDCSLTPEEFSLAKGAAALIAEKYSGDGGARDLKRCAAELCRKAGSALSKGAKSVKFSMDDIENILRDFRRPEFPQEDLEPEVGTVNGMAVTTAGEGVILPIECRAARGCGKLVVTGNFRDIARDSIEVALNYVKCSAEMFGIEPGFFDTHDIYVHYPRTYISNDGNSAGIANVTAILSAVLGKEPLKGVSLTGEITLSGKVLEVGGLAQKIAGAKKRGITCVVYPERCRAEVEALDPAVRRDMRLIPVNRYSDAFPEVFGIRQPEEQKNAQTAVLYA